MIQFSGYGLIIVVLDYFGGIFLLSQLSPYLFKTFKEQYITLLLFHIIITIINFCLVKYLNREEVNHTVFELRLEYAVLATGLLLLPIVIMMGKGILY